MRYPVKYLLPLTVVIPVLAAFVVQTYCAAPARRERAGRALVLIGLGFLAAIAFIVWFAQVYPNQGAPWKVILFNGAGRALFLAFILAGVMALPRLKSPSMRLGCAIGLAVLMIADFMTHNHRLNPRVKSDIYSLKLPPLEEMDPRPKRGESRAMLRYKAYLEMHSGMISDLYNNFLIFRMGLAYNCNLLDQIPKTDGFFPLEIKYYSRLLRRMNNQETLPKGLMAFMGVCQMTTEENVYEFQTADNPLPFALIGAEPVLVNDAEAMNAVLDPAFDPGETVYLPETAALLSADAGSSGGSVVIRDFQTDRIVLSAVSDSPAIVSIAQAYYPAWTAKIDGEPAPLWRANFAFQAVEIPEGRHEIVLEYDDTAFQAGCVLSGLGLAGLCVTGVRQFGSKRRA